MAALLIGVLLGPGEQDPLCPFQLMRATMCEDSTITHDLYPRDEQRHSSAETSTACIATFI